VRKFAVVVLAFALLMVASAVAPVMALGPVNNPHAEANPAIVYLVTPGGQVVHEFVQTGRINMYLDAKPNGKGIMNNVNLIVDSPMDLAYLGAHSAEFMSMPGWIFLSGEMTEGGTWVSSNPAWTAEGDHGAFYWFLRIFNTPVDEALAIANESPYGIYLGGHYVGWGEIG